MRIKETIDKLGWNFYNIKTKGVDKKMLKYNLGEKVYFLYENKINTGIIIARKYLDEVIDFNNYHLYYMYWTHHKRIAPPGCRNNAYYVVRINKTTLNQEFSESNLFKNENDLINSLHA